MKALKKYLFSGLLLTGGIILNIFRVFAAGGDFYISEVECVDTGFVNGFAERVYVAVKTDCSFGVSGNEYSGVKGYAMKGPYEAGDFDMDFGDADFYESNRFEISENGYYYFAAVDGLGRIAPAVCEIDTIDRVAPVIADVTSSPKGGNGLYGKTSVISVRAYDTKSRLARQAFSFDDGRSYQEDYKAEVNKNGTYYIRVRDGLGNVARAAFEVTDIDDRMPEIAVKGSLNTGGKAGVLLTVNAADERSGIDSVWYMDPAKGEEVNLGYFDLKKEARCSTLVQKSGEYEFFCSDGAGNIGYQKVRVEADEKKQDSNTAKKSSSSQREDNPKTGTTSKKTVVIGEKNTAASTTVRGQELVMRSPQIISDERQPSGGGQSTTAVSVTGKKEDSRGGGDEETGKTFRILDPSEDEEQAGETDEELCELFSVSVDLISGNGIVSAGEDGDPALEKEYIEEELPPRLSAGGEIPTDTASGSREEKRKTGVNPVLIVVCGIAMMALLLGLMVFLLKKYGIVDVTALFNREGEVDEDE